MDFIYVSTFRKVIHNKKGYKDQMIWPIYPACINTKHPIKTIFDTYFINIYLISKNAVQNPHHNSNHSVDANRPDHAKPALASLRNDSSWKPSFWKCLHCCPGFGCPDFHSYDMIVWLYDCLLIMMINVLWGEG